MDWSLILQNAVGAIVAGEVVTYALAAIGLNIHFGYTGLLNFGQAGFVALGAYAVGMGIVTYGLPLWLALLVGFAAVAVLALLLGVPTLRLRADYLAIVTIAAAEIIRLFFRAASLEEWTGGADGIQGYIREFRALNPFPRGDYGAGWFTYAEDDLFILILGWTLVALCLLLTFLLMRSPWGRVLKSIREDEDAVRSLGKNVFVYKMQSLVLGGFFGCLAGFMFAFDFAVAQPNIYSTELTFFLYTIMILGGAARVFGPVVGSMIFWAILSFTDNFLNEGVRSGLIPDWLMNSTQVGQVRFMLVGLALMLLMIFRPQGIFGDKRELQLDAR